MKDSIGLCNICLKLVFVNEPYVRHVLDRMPVHGRIGSPDNRIMGWTKGTEIVNHASCEKDRDAGLI